MNVKNLNPLERHIEKIVLAVAAAGAIFIGYLAIQPITIPDQPGDVKAVDVEPRVTQAVEELDAKRADVAKMGNLTPALKRYDQDYIKTVDGEPVPHDVLVAVVPQFGPRNVGVERFANTPHTVNDGYQVVTPTVPPPTDVTTVGSLFVVNDLTGVDAQGIPLPAPAVPTTHNVTLVDVCGFIPMAAFTAQMNDPALKPNQVLPVDQRRSVVYRIEVQRRERVNGTWTAYQPVTPSKAGGDLPVVDWDSLTDVTAQTTFNDIDTLFKRIVEPDFYTMPNGQTLTPESLAKARATPPAAVVPPGAAGAVRPPGTPPAPAPDDSETPSPQASLTPDLTAMKAMPKVPFWFYDETAVGGHEYQYQVRIVMLNPTFHAQFGLQNPAMAKTPLLYSPWTVVASPITVPSEEYFFVTGGLMNKNIQQVGVKIYKWLNGTWYVRDTYIQLGAPVAGRVEITSTTPVTNLDVNTGYTLVDVSAVGTDTQAILLNPAGELVSRSVNAEARSDLYARLAKLSQHVIPPPTSQPAGGGTGTGTVPPVTPNPNPNSTGRRDNRPGGTE